MDQLVTGAWLEDQLGSPDLRILDCTASMEVRPDGGRAYTTGRAAWEAGHIPGSAHVDLVHELSDASSPLPFMLPPPEQFGAVMGQLGVGAGSRVVLYDSYVNAWAARVWWMLRAFGFDQAAVLDGGWRAWTQEGRPTSTEPEPKHEPATFVPRYRPGVFVGKDEVLAGMDDNGTCVVDALPEVVFRGERQDYARPGHIPGARNVNFLRLVEKDTHRYLPEDQLRVLMAPVVDAAPSQVITYCGGAIAASSDAFVLNLLGVKNLAIYDGSLSEWAADPALPLALGE
jgi:thiosulfate/3-mercaptopyruvate sulfurtransferase